MCGEGIHVDGVVGRMGEDDLPVVERLVGNGVTLDEDARRRT